MNKDFNLNLTIVSIVAIVAIMGIVAVVLHSPAGSSTLSKDNSFSLNNDNIAGNARAVWDTGDCEACMARCGSLAPGAARNECNYKCRKKYGANCP